MNLSFYYKNIIFLEQAKYCYISVHFYAKNIFGNILTR